MLTYYTTFTDNAAKVTILAETALLSVIGYWIWGEKRCKRVGKIYIIGQ